jgi:hypothetical protein
MKYIIDIDALKDCLDLLPTSYTEIGSVNLNDVHAMIDKFPKEKLDNYPSVNTRSAFEICSNCGNYGWDMPQCRHCNSENGYKCFTRKYNDNE